MTFLYPYVLFALAVPLLLALLAVLLHRRAGRGWRLLVSPSHPELVYRRPRWQAVLPTALALLALVGIILAAARPINGYMQSEGAATGRNLLIALDISRSMETQDVSPSRLEEARAAAYELIDALPSDKIGLIVFSGEADVVVPLTYDHTALRDALEQVNRGWAGYGGTNFGLLLRCAMQNFARSAPEGANALVILSDGEDTVDSSLQIAEEAKQSNLLVITVGIGTPAGGAIPDPAGDNGLWEDANGRHVISKLDMNALRRFSEATGGDFFTMSSGADLSAFAREAANKLERHEETFTTGRVPLDLFAWFAVPALLALLAAIILGTEWRTARHSSGVWLLLLAVATLPAHAAPESAYEQGLQALKEGHTDDARLKLSEALLATSPDLQAAAHLALGNMQTRATFDKLRSLYTPSDEESNSPAGSPGIEALQGIVDELKKNLIPYQDALSADSSLTAARSNADKVQEFIKKLEEEIERLKQQQQNQQQDQQNKDDKQDQQQDQQNKDDKQDQQQDQQNKDDKQDQQQEQQNKDDKQDQQQNQQNKDDKQDQQQDQQNKDDKQDQQQDQQNKDDKQDQQQDQQNKDDKQDQQQNQQNKDDKQDQQQDQQNKDDKQDQQQDQQNKDDKQDQQQDQQNKDDKQDQQQDLQNKDDNRNPQNGGDGQQAMATQPQELSDEEKSKQRAAGILRMHLEEEKGSPIPHDNRMVRPPSKDY